MSAGPQALLVVLLPVCSGWSGVPASSRLDGRATRLEPSWADSSPLRVRRPGRTSPRMDGVLGRFRAKRTARAAPAITEGDKLPSVEVDVLLFDLLKRLETTGDAPPLPEDGLQTDVPAAVLPIGDALGNGTSVLVCIARISAWA